MPGAAAERSGELRSQAVRLPARAPEHHLDRVLARRAPLPGRPRAARLRRRARGSSRRARSGGAAAATSSRPSPPAPQCSTGSRPAARPIAIVRRATAAASGRQRSTRPCSTTSAPLCRTSGTSPPELLRDAPRRRVAPSRDEHQAYPARARARRWRSACAARPSCRCAAACRRCRGRSAGRGGPPPASLARPDLDALDHVAGLQAVHDVHAGGHAAEQRVARRRAAAAARA